MRPSLVLAVALGLALIVPARALGAGPGVTSLDDGAVAYYLSPDHSQCAIVDLHWVAQRPLDGELSYSQHLNVQLSGPTCQPSETSNGVGLEASDYRIVGLTNAWVDKALTVAGHPVSVDIAWTATGTPEIYSDQWPNNTVVIMKSVKAHLTGTVTVDGVAWTANQQTALLRSGTITSFPAAPTPAVAPAPPAAPANVAFGATTTASNWLQTSEPAKAVDGDLSTMWNSGAYAPQWIEVDLGRDYPISAIELMPAQYPTPAHTIHRVFGRAADSVTAVLLHQFSGTTADAQWLTVSVPSSTCLRYVRVETTASPSWVAWKEIVVLTTGAPGSQTCSRVLPPTDTASPLERGSAPGSGFPLGALVIALAALGGGLGLLRRRFD